MELEEFLYNGIVIYNVNTNDFLIISDIFTNKKRISTKGLMNKKLVDRIKKSDGHTINCGICYNGIIVDLRELQ